MPFTLFGRTIGKVGIVGSGNIGPDIALHFSQSLLPYDVSVVVVDILQSQLDEGKKKIQSKLTKAKEKGLLKKEEEDKILGNILFTTDYKNLSDADLVIEAAFEKIDVKQSIFEKCEKICPKKTILASNSSHITPEEIFKNLRDKQRSLVIHYFFPAEKNPLIEIVPSNETDPKIVDYLMKFYEFIGKAPIKVKSRYGYAVNPVFEALLLSSALTVEKGMATVKQVDAIVQNELGMGVGPFTAHNLSGGNPLTQHGLKEMHLKIMPWFRSPKILDDQVQSGKPWDVAKKGETVEYNDETREAVSREVMSVYFGISCELVDSGITNISDLEMAIDLGLSMNPPFSMMNRKGIRKALEMVEGYAKKNEGFKIPDILKKQASLNMPWKIMYVLKEDRGEVSIVKIRRPRVLNALNDDVMEQLKEIFLDIKNDSKIKGAILTGFGNRAFVSGADIGMLASQKTPEEAEAVALRSGEVLNIIENLGKPVVCAMNGLAFGGGNELAMACTARIARKGQKVFIGQPEPRLGIIPGNGGTQRLPRLIGIERAWPILRTANPISSAQAKEYGLIYDEVEGDLIEAAIQLLEDILSGKVKITPIPKGPIPVPERLPDVDIGHLSKKIDSLLQQAILEGARMTLEEGLRLEAKLFGQCWLTKDRMIGMENFMKNGPRVNANFIHE